MVNIDNDMILMLIKPVKPDNMLDLICLMMLIKTMTRNVLLNTDKS